MTIRQSVNYGNAEVRGQLRLWKKKLAQNYTIFERAFELLLLNGRPGPLVNDMVRCTRAGRKRAFEKINKSFGPGVTLESVSLGKNNRSLAIWSILKPRAAVYVASAAFSLSKSERASLTQDCVAVNYIVVGCSEDEIKVAEGLWTLEVPDHALGRAVERSRFLHPEALIREAHTTLLNLPVSVLEQKNFTNRTDGAYIKAGAGCFVGYFRLAEDVSIDEAYSASFRAKTWLDDNQLHERQIVLHEKAEVGQRLGDGWLQPNPLCHIEPVENGMQVRSWHPMREKEISENGR
jgi:hypothetical protein